MAKKPDTYFFRLITQSILLLIRVFKIFIAPSKQVTKPQRKTNAERPASGNSVSYVWQELEDFDFEIVGESNYQSTIKSLAGDHGKYSSGALFRALLVPEDNPYDHLAVRVDAEGGGTVGYMSKDDARSFRRRLAAKRLGDSITLCRAQVTGGGTRNGEKFSYGVRLAIKPFE